MPHQCSAQWHKRSQEPNCSSWYLHDMMLTIRHLSHTRNRGLCQTLYGIRFPGLRIRMSKEHQRTTTNVNKARCWQHESTAEYFRRLDISQVSQSTRNTKHEPTMFVLPGYVNTFKSSIHIQPIEPIEIHRVQ